MTFRSLLQAGAGDETEFRKLRRSLSTGHTELLSPATRTGVQEYLQFLSLLYDTSFTFRFNESFGRQSSGSRRNGWTFKPEPGRRWLFRSTIRKQSGGVLLTVLPIGNAALSWTCLSAPLSGRMRWRSTSKEAD